jgi:hypothetical protein
MEICGREVFFKPAFPIYAGKPLNGTSKQVLHLTTKQYAYQKNGGFPTMKIKKTWQTKY